MCRKIEPIFKIRGKPRELVKYHSKKEVDGVIGVAILGFSFF